MLETSLTDQLIFTPHLETGPSLPGRSQSVRGVAPTPRGLAGLGDPRDERPAVRARQLGLRPCQAQAGWTLAGGECKSLLGMGSWVPKTNPQNLRRGSDVARDSLLPVPITPHPHPKMDPLPPKHPARNCRNQMNPQNNDR